MNTKKSKLETRLAYVKGLTEGLSPHDISKEALIFQEMMSIMEGMTREIQRVKHRYEELSEYVDAIDEDLGDLEWLVYDDEDWEDVENLKRERVLFSTGEADDDDEEGYFHMICPNCEEEILVVQEVLEDKNQPAEVVCPECGESFALENQEPVERLARKKGPVGESAKRKDEAQRGEPHVYM